MKKLLSAVFARGRAARGLSVFMALVSLTVLVQPSPASALIKITKQDVIDYNRAEYDAWKSFQGGKMIDAQLEYYLQPMPEAQSDDPSIKEVAARVTAGITSAYDKVAAINDWVATNMTYGPDPELQKEIEDKRSASKEDYYYYLGAVYTLATGGGKCGELAYLTIALLRASGIPARAADGIPIGYSSLRPGRLVYMRRTEGRDVEEDLYYSEDSHIEELFDLRGFVTSDHAWCEAWVDGRWVIMDPAWNNSYAWLYDNQGDTGRKVPNGNGIRKYFDMSLEDLSAHHIGGNGEDNFVVAVPTTATVIVDGKTTDLKGYHIKGQNCYRVRDLAYVLNGTKKQFNVVLGSTVFGGGGYLDGEPYVAVGGEMSSIGEGIKVTRNSSFYGVRYCIGGAEYVPISALADQRKFGIAWDSVNNTIIVDTSVSSSAALRKALEAQAG
jgi:hypothetical protein